MYYLLHQRTLVFGVHVCMALTTVHFPGPLAHDGHAVRDDHAVRGDHGDHGVHEILA